jgi:exosortase/archaeosortase family protein
VLKYIKGTKESNTISLSRFVLIYVVLMAFSLFIIGYEPVTNFIDINGVYTNFIVVLTSKILRVIEIPNAYEGSIMHLPTTSLEVSFGCNGLEAFLIYSIAVLAFPSAWKSKVIGIIIGFLVIQLLNIIRLLALAFSATYYVNLFRTLHLHIAPFIMVAISFGLLFLYLRYINYGER